MSTEICKLCNKDSTPWVHFDGYINGHICQDCFENEKRKLSANKLSWIDIKNELPEKEKEVLLLFGYKICEEEDFNNWKDNYYKFVAQGYISVDEYEDVIAFYKSPHLSFKAESEYPSSFQINIKSQFFPIEIDWVTHWMEIPLL